MRTKRANLWSKSYRNRLEKQKQRQNQLAEEEMIRNETLTPISKNKLNELLEKHKIKL